MIGVWSVDDGQGDEPFPQQKWNCLLANQFLAYGDAEGDCVHPHPHQYLACYQKRDTPLLNNVHSESSNGKGNPSPFARKIPL